MAMILFYLARAPPIIAPQTNGKSAIRTSNVIDPPIKTRIDVGNIVVAKDTMIHEKITTGIKHAKNPRNALPAFFPPT